MIDLGTEELRRMHTVLSALYPRVHLVDIGPLGSEDGIRELCFQIGKHQVVTDIETAIAVKSKDK